jgi:chromate transporter
MAASGRLALNQSAAPTVFHSTREVFEAALTLGLTSFGGPIAHLGYFERAYVRERRWLSAEEYGELVSLCQMLPGPTSSQVGFLIGLHKAGWPGALAAWTGFTLPSAILMYSFAVLVPSAPGLTVQAVLHGLMLTAVVVVAQAVWSMSRTLCPDLWRRAIALACAALLLIERSGTAQLLALVGGAVAGAVLCNEISATPSEVTEQRSGWLAGSALAVFCALLIAVPLVETYAPRSLAALAGIFYRAGALVFGGGHVVLPLLQQALVPGAWISDDRFIAGYGFAQAMPGPLFTIAAYLGAASAPAHSSPAWATVALLAIFLPGLLLAIAGRSILARLTNVRLVRNALAGTNAAVVGVLAAALCTPVWTTGVRSLLDAIIVVLGFALLQSWRTPPIIITGLCILASLVSPVRSG